MKDEEQQLLEEINTLKKKMVEDKKGNNKMAKKQTENKPDKTSGSSFDMKKVLVTAMPFLLIIVFLIGFYVGSNYEKNKMVDEGVISESNNEEVSTPYVDPISEPEAGDGFIPSVAEPDECFDSDGGVKEYQTGTVFFNSAVYYDSCFNDTRLREYSCDPDNQYRTTMIDCDVCSEGVCIQFEERAGKCKETDNYVDFKTKGWVIDAGGLYVDSCSRDSLEEYFCSTFGFADTRYTLCDRCEDGACVPGIEEAETCTDTDGGINLYEKGSVLDANGNEGTDNCQGVRTLEEYHCNEYGYIGKLYKLCNQCVEGACVKT